MIKTKILLALVVATAAIGLVVIAATQTSALQAADAGSNRSTVARDAASGAAATGMATTQPADEPGQAASAPNPLRNVYFGEQHLHTANSPDAFVVGTRGTWEDAYNWALGNAITLSTTGESITKSTPYDFVGITDHAEYFGVMPSLIEADDPLYQTDLARQLRDPNADPGAPDSAINKILGSIITGTPMPEFVTPELLATNWQRYVETPTFAVWALKDPESGNLDRIQIVKGFINNWGRADEVIYDVALSDGRSADPETGRVPPVGNTVDVRNATYTNDIGDTELRAVWTDPNFDPEQRAVYYVRVLEIPTPRWSTYDSARNNLPLSEHVPSPIWYTPGR